MEKTKQIKAIREVDDLYTVSGDELRKKLKNIKLPAEYQWIMLNCNEEVYLSENTVKGLNELWKNRTK